MASKPIIEEIWIINKGGITLFNQNTSDPVNQQLFGAFLSSINQFANNMLNDHLNHIDFGENRVSFCRCLNQELLIVCKGSIQNKPEVIQKYLEKIRTQLEINFGNKCLEWDGDTSIQEKISKCIDLISDKDNWLGLNLSKEASRKILSNL